MNISAFIFFIFWATFLWLVPKKYAVIPMLASCCYMTLGQGIKIGCLSLPIFRMMMVVGLVRSIFKKEKIEGGLNKIDKLIIFLSGWLFFSSFFHNGLDSSGPVYIGGFIFNLLSIYFLIRIWTQDSENFSEQVRIIALMLIPLALAMLIEKMTSKNMFSIFGGVPITSLIREGKVRAQGPFRHPILAGTVGGTCVPMFVGIFKQNKLVAGLGIIASVIIIFSSSSSGPVMSFFLGVGAMVMWKFRNFTRMILNIVFLVYLILSLVMKNPPYYLISKIDISGGSTGWHRAILIDKTFSHLSEWWLFGTDQTRDWMPNQGIGASVNHTDITNYYISFGIMGGVLAIILFVYIIIYAFQWVGFLINSSNHSNRKNFMVWAFGAGLFSHVATGISVSYFDQSMLFYWFNIALISSIYSSQSSHRFSKVVGGE